MSDERFRHLFATITSRYQGRCLLCPDGIRPGERICIWKQTGVREHVYTHEACTPPGDPADLRCPRCLTPRPVLRRRYGRRGLGVADCPSPVCNRKADIDA